LCKQRREIVGFKFQIVGRLNRRRRTYKWTFQKGILSLQTYKNYVEYGYSEGFTRRGLIGIHFWIFYAKNFSLKFRQKLLEYLYYSKYKNFINYKLLLEQNTTKNQFTNLKKKNVKTKSKKI
jgi:ribosomal protein S3